MKILPYFLFLLTCVNYAEWIVPHPSSTWELANEVEGVKVYTKSVEDSNLKELKIEMWFKQTTLDEIIAVINDGTSYTDWLYKCMHAENIQRISPKEKIDYFQLDFPWPLSDRDIYNHAQMSQDSTTKQLTIKSDAVTTFSEKDGFVRVPSNRTRWYFFPKENGDIFLEYYTAPNPGGNIPNWLVNLVIDKGPTKTMLQLKKLVQAQKGKAPKVDWIAN